jgi:hypothetical protein
MSDKDAAKKKNKKFGNVTIARVDGEQIILPEGMSYPDARKWLETIEKSEETIVNFHSEMKAYPGMVLMLFSEPCRRSSVMLI